ncbi:hypothetical protein BSKO_03171 [Bryopsis sp. KO-2023]|nr:hypothetical protein BSKO_03171 [Bryopsis sp. KO-2023]
MSNVSSEASIGTRLKVWFDGIPFATRSILALCSGIYLMGILIGFDNMGSVCIQPSSVVKNLEVYRVFTAVVFHVGLLHIFFNMLAFVPIGGTLERTLGTVMFGYLILVIVVMSSFFSISMAHLLLYTGIYPRAMVECTIGFSGVIFGLVVVNTQLSGASHYSIFGFFEVPAKFYAWVLLLFWQLLLPGVSFIGHLSGILVGQLYVWGLLTWLMLSNDFVNKIERSFACGICLRQPNFVLTSAAGPQLPTQQPGGSGSGGSGGFAGMWRSLQGWSPLRSGPEPFDGQSRTVGGDAAGPSLPWAGPGAAAPAVPQSKPSPPKPNGKDPATFQTPGGGVTAFTGKANFIGDPGTDPEGPSVPSAAGGGREEVLLEMGFHPESVKAALEASGGDLDQAANILSQK